MRDFEGLLLAWRQAYRFDRHVRRPYFTLLPGKALQERLLLQNADSAHIGSIDVDLALDAARLAAGRY